METQQLQELLKKCSIPEKRRLLALSMGDKSIYEEIPIGIKDFILSQDYLNLKGRIWPSVQTDLSNLFNGAYDEACFIEGIGSGKSFLSSIIITYMTYKTLCLLDPQATYGLAPGAKIAFLNMATLQNQARDVVFGEIKAKIDNSAWFQTFYPPDKTIQSRLRFQKDIFIVPGNSSENFPLGYNILGAVMDEASFYHQPGVNSGRFAKDQAEEIYNALIRRIQSRYGHIKQQDLKGLLCMISSPRYENDFTEKKYLEARTNKRIFAVRRSLWEAKPKGTYSKETFYDDVLKIFIPIDFKMAWERNPHKSRRDIGAFPSSALNPYMDVERLNTIMIESNLSDPVTDRDSFGYPIFKQDFKGISGIHYAFHVDLGLSRDACGLAMGHWDSARQRAVIDYVDRIETGPKKQLDFEKVRSIILELRRRGFAFFKVSYDNFQSVDSRQILENKGFDVEALSVDRTLDAYDTFLAFINQGELDIYRHEYLLRECSALELMEGKKVDHPPNGSKDVADAVAGVCYWLGQLRGAFKPSQATIVNRGNATMITGRAMRYGNSRY